MIAFLLVTLSNAAGMEMMSKRYPSAHLLAKQHEPMSLEHALSKVPKLPHSVQVALTQKHAVVRAHSEHALHQSQKAGQDPLSGDVAGALQKAKDVLNQMMEETEHELDEAVLECKEFDFHTVSILDENTRLRAALGQEVAVARSEINEAQQTINEAKSELESIRLAAEEAAATCAASIKVQKAGLEILESDLAISEKVQNMTQCDEDTSLVQCGSGYAARFHFAGKSAAPLKDLKSKQAMLAAQRAARMALHKPLDQFQYKKTKKHAKKHIGLAHVKKTRGKKTDPALENSPFADGVNKTTEADDDAMEAIENLTVLTMPEPISFDPNDHIQKCSVSGSPMCPMLRDALSQLTSEVRWARDQAKTALEEMEAECLRLATEYKQQTDDWQRTLDEASVKFSTATGNLNAAEENIRLKVEEANTLIEELTQHRTDCAAKIKEGAETLCGIKTIRQELYQMQGVNPFIQDCEVSEWQPGECSVECGGGELELTRTIVVQPSGGAECPPLVEKEACNTQECPIDCVMGDWSEYSACSKDCGGGVMQRSRIPITEEEHGGRGCGEAVEPVQCNVDACDRPCILEDWSEWSECTKACDWGYQMRQRGVAEEAGPTGYCPESWDWDRLQAQWCAEFYCPPDLTCSAKLDLVVMVDGSGSIEWGGGGGWAAEKVFTNHLFDLLEFGSDGAKAGVVLFSWEAELIQELTEDKATLKSAVDGMSWPGWNTDTAAGLMMASNTLASGGRPDVSKDKTIVFLITDGNPNDMTATNAAAETLKESARLIVVPVGRYVDMDSVYGWASYPAEENVMGVDEFPELQVKIGGFLADLCHDLKCSESMTGNGQDYHGCQTATKNGLTCQKWSDQSPHSHSFITDWYPSAHLGDHNFCRNPDGDSTIWCYTTDPGSRWNYCEPRKTVDGQEDTSVPTDYTPEW